MKKLLLSICFLFAVHCSYSQMYFGLNTHISVPTNGTTLREIGLYNYASTLLSITLTEQQTSFGGGFFGSVCLGYQINNKIGIELNAGYHLANKIQTTDSYLDGSYDYTFTTNALSFRPAVLFTIAENDKRRLFSRIGAIYSTADFSLEVGGMRGSQRFESEQVFINGSGLGMETAIGVNWNLSPKLTLVTELFITSLSLTPESSELTKYELGGYEGLDTMTVRQKNILYQKEVVVTASTNNNEPEQALRFKIPFNGAGLKIGLRWDMHSRRKKADDTL